MADTVTSTYDLVITTEMARGRDTSTRTFTFPVNNGTPLTNVRELAADLEGSLTGGYSTLFQPTTWRDEDLEEEEYQIIEATSELVQKTVTKLDTGGEVTPNLIVGSDYLVMAARATSQPEGWDYETPSVTVTAARETFTDDPSVAFFTTEIYEKGSDGDYEHLTTGIEESKFTVTGAGNDYLNLSYEFDDSNQGLSFKATPGTSSAPTPFTVQVAYEGARTFQLVYNPTA